MNLFFKILLPLILSALFVMAPFRAYADLHGPPLSETLEHEKKQLNILIERHNQEFIVFAFAIFSLALLTLVFFAYVRISKYFPTLSDKPSVDGEPDRPVESSDSTKGGPRE